MAGYRAGTAFVAITPSFKGFQTKVAAFSKTIKPLKVKAELESVDTSRVEDKLRRVTRRRTAKVDVDTSAAMRGLSALENRLDKLAKGRFLINAAIAASPIAVPAAAGALGAGAGAVAAGGAAAVGVGGFAALGAASLGRIEEKRKAMQDAEGPKQRARILASFTKAQLKATEGIGRLEMAWSKFLDRIDPALLGALTQGMGALSQALRPLGAFIRPVAKSLGAMFDVVGNAAGSKGFTRFARTMGEFTAGIIPRVTGMVLNLAKGFGSLFTAFMPVGTSMADGLLRLTERFAQWAASVQKSEGFKRFVAYVQQTGPQLMSTLGAIGSAIISVGKALAPLAASMLRGIQVFAQWLARTAEAHPQLIRVAASVGIFTAGVTALARPLGALVGVVKLLFGGLGMAIKVIKIVTLNLRVLFAVLRMSPIGMVITAIGLLVAGFVLAYKKSDTFRRIVDAAWAGIKKAARAAWDNVLKPVFGFLVDAFKKGIDWAKQFWNFLKSAWSGLKKVFRNGVAAVVDVFLGMVETVLNGAAKAFGWIPGLGGKLKSAREDFARFRKSVNESIRGIDSHKNVWIKAKWGINERSGGITLTSAAGIAFSGKGRIPAGFAVGGAVNGPGGPREDKIPAMLSNGEHVFTASDVKKAGGQDAMYAIRSMIQRGEFAKRGDLQRYADGGAVNVGAQTSAATRQARGSLGRVDALYDRVAASTGAAIKAVLSGLVKNLSAFGGAGRPLGPGGSLSAGQIIRGQQFAKSQQGKPYVWGGVGPGGYDCSGFQSAIYNSAVGRNPYSRLGSTGTMPWAGMRSGVGRYSIGWFTGSPGHMSGDLGGLGVESRGGDGVVVGGGARSPLNGMFNRVAHYRDGGGVSGPGGPTGDRIPALLSDGEYVVNAKAVDKYGTHMFEAINAQRFAKGGKVTKREERQIDRALRGFGPQDTGRDMLSELRDLKSTLRDTLGRNSPIIDRADRIGGHMVDQAQRMVKWTKATEKLSGRLDNIQQARDTLRRSVQDQFRNDPFGGSLAEFSLQVRADRNDARRMRRALQTARKKGLSGGLFRQLAESGNFTLAQEFAGSSRAEIRRYERLYGQRNHASRAVGGFVGTQVYGRESREARRSIDRLEHATSRLERRMGRFDDKLERAVERGTRQGNRQGGARQRARSR